MMINFPADEARDIVYGEHPLATVVEDKITGTTRWSTVHDIVFQYKKKFYAGSYSVGATELQDGHAFQYDQTVDFTEVVPVEVTTTEYRPA